jgi:serine/threonine-protein kinase
MIGRTLPGGYLVQHLAAIGGMGRVYVAEQTALARTVAVKVIHPHLINDEQAAGRFIAEARAASRLNHPNSIAIFDFGTTEDGQRYLVMEYLRGKDLAQVADAEGPLPIPRIADIVRQTLAALEEAHEIGIIHRDLKPENIILEPLRSGRDFVKVVDYGLAKTLEPVPLAREKGAPKAPLTAPGFVCGTPEYMSPEQGRGQGIDSRADLYSVGVLLFSLLTGRLPFEGESAMRVLLAHANDPVPDPRTVAPDREIPEALALVTLRALEKDRERRWSSARELADAIAAACPPAASSGRMSATRCNSCGAMNGLVQKFCGECGAPIAPPSGGHAVASTTPRPPSTGSGEPRPLVGREEDLAWLEARREESRAMPCGARLSGPPGIGKSSLLRTFVDRCAEAGDAAVLVRLTGAWGEVSGFAVRDAIAKLAGGSPADWRPAGEEARMGLADVFAPVVSDTPISSRPDRDRNGELRSPESRRQAAAEALRWAMLRAVERSSSGSALLAVDDLDEVDGVSRNAFADVLAEPPLTRALLVVTYASDPTSVAAVVGEARALSGIPGPTGVVVPPLQLEQSTHWRASEPAPDSFAEMVAKRIERLPTDARWVLQAIAVLGDEPDGETLSKTLPVQVELADAIDALRRAGFLEETPRRGGLAVHALLRQVALGLTPAGVRRELHASALRARGSDAPLEVRSLHAAQAALCGATSDDDDGAPSAFEALLLLEDTSRERRLRGDVAGSTSALRRALELSRRELFRGTLDDPARAIVLFSRKLANLLTETRSFTEAEGVLREALDLAGPDDVERAHLLGALAKVAHARERSEDVRSFLAEALTLARRTDSRELVSSLEDLSRSLIA